MLECHLNESIDLSSRNMKFINKSVNWIMSYFDIDKDKSIIDFGCGPGLYTTLFAKEGAEVTGIDFSKNSIDYAKNKAKTDNLSIEYLNENYLEFNTDKKFDLITMIFCDFCALSPSQRKTLLGKFHKFLNKGGSILLDVHSLNIFNEREESSTYELNQLYNFWSTDDYYSFLNVFKYEKEKVTLDKFTIIEESKTRVVYNWLQHFDEDSIRKEFKENGFDIVDLYSDVAGEPFHEGSENIAVVAKKH